MNIPLDSTELIELTRRRPAPHLRALFESGHSFAVSPINITEVYARMRPHEAERIEALFSRLQCYPVTASIAERAGLLMNTWAHRGRTIALTDATIAATALEHDLTLMTANRRDFPMPELKFYPA